MAAYIPALLQAAASIGGGMLSSAGQGKETKIQKRQRKMIDELIASLKGGGAFSDLFKTDDAAFQKSVVDPLMSKFNNQIAPGIQQQFISSGLQRGTGMSDQLSRAGVDMQSLINQQYLPFMQQGQQNMMNTINSILGAGTGAAPGLSGGERFQQSAGGYLGGESFQDLIKQISAAATQKPAQTNDNLYWDMESGLPAGYGA